MQKASEYRKHADECRALAAETSVRRQRDQLLTLAQIWTDMADTRLRSIQKRLDREKSHTSAG